jgi:hypothetical protein
MEFKDQEDKNAQEEFLVYLLNHAQKITEAVYRVTDLLSDREPLKWELRERALTVFMEISRLKEGEMLEKISIFDSVEKAINQQLVLLSLFSGKHSALAANFEILKNEYLTILKNIVGKKHKSLLGDFLTSGSFLPNRLGTGSPFPTDIGQKKTTPASIGQQPGQKMSVSNNKTSINDEKKKSQIKDLNVPKLEDLDKRQGEGKNRNLTQQRRGLVG